MAFPGGTHSQPGEAAGADKGLNWVLDLTISVTPLGEAAGTHRPAGYTTQHQLKELSTQKSNQHPANSSASKTWSEHPTTFPELPASASTPYNIYTCYTHSTQLMSALQHLTQHPPSRKTEKTVGRLNTVRII